MSIAAPQNLFGSEYELELENWLRRRFRAVCICYMALGVAVLVVRLAWLAMQGQAASWLALAIPAASAAASLGVIAYFYFARRWAAADRAHIVRDASFMILMLGGISFIKGLLILELTDQDSDFLMPLFLWHFIACLFLPWTPRESLRAVAPLLAVWMLGVLLLDHAPWSQRLLSVIFAPAIVLPGWGLCEWRLRRHSRDFRSRMVGKHFVTMRQEYARARSIHESMFPVPHDDGYVRFDYTYAPMRELGGDYVHLNLSPQGLAHVTLIDVTGHGLAAALTVNRLYGELERIRAEAPAAEPGEVIGLLNRYVHLTMSRHNIFVTALCVTLDPYMGMLHWASAGHPPAFLRGVNGAVKHLASTAMLLGAVDSGEFAAEQRTIELSPGDVILLYTDGAFEGRNRQGRPMGIAALDELLRLQPPPRHWPQFIAAAVQKHTAGRADDDVLIAALTFKAQRPQATHARRAMAAS